MAGKGNGFKIIQQCSRFAYLSLQSFTLLIFSSFLYSRMVLWVTPFALPYLKQPSLQQTMVAKTIHGGLHPTFCSDDLCQVFLSWHKYNPWHKAQETSKTDWSYKKKEKKRYINIKPFAFTGKCHCKSDLGQWKSDYSLQILPLLIALLTWESVGLVILDSRHESNPGHNFLYSSPF